MNNEGIKFQWRAVTPEPFWPLFPLTIQASANLSSLSGLCSKKQPARTPVTWAYICYINTFSFTQKQVVSKSFWKAICIFSPLLWPIYNKIKKKEKKKESNWIFCKGCIFMSDGTLMRSGELGCQKWLCWATIVEDEKWAHMENLLLIDSAKWD